MFTKRQTIFYTPWGTSTAIRARVVTVHRDMTANEILACSYQAQGIIAACSLALSELNANNVDAKAGSIALALDAANALLAPVHDALESHEGKRE